MTEQYFSYDPATGQRGAGFPAPGMNMPAAQAPYQWDPNGSPADPHEVPFDDGAGSPDVGEIPDNIQVDAPGNGYDFGAPRSADDTADPHDAPYTDTSDGDDDCEDCGPIASNIVVDSRGLIPGPLSRSKGL
jgi:hypothetical protein